MKEIRIHGRGGQGAVTSSQILSIAAFRDGKQSQAFPMFGVERQGAPVQAFTRMSNKPINVRSQVYEPDYVIVLDPTLLGEVDVTDGLKNSGLLIINSNKKPAELGIKGKFSVYAVDITKIALDVIGKPFVNVAALGAFAALTKEISIESVNKAIDEVLGEKGKIADLNKKAAKEVYENAKRIAK